MSWIEMSESCSSKLIFTVLVAAVGCGFQHGFHYGIINTPADTFQNWINITRTKQFNNKVPPSQEIFTIWSMVKSIFMVGGFIGALLTGYCSERYGRKKSLFWNNFLILGAVACMLLSKRANSPQLLMTGRFIAGINAGLNSGLCPMYLVEIAPDEIRGLIAGLFPVFIHFGIMVSYIVGMEKVLGTDSEVHTVFMVPLIPACLQVIFLLMCPESPKNLIIGQDKEDEAEKALKWLRGEENVSKCFKAIIEEDNLVKELHASTLKRLFSDIKLRTPLIICVIISLATNFCGISTILIFSSDTFEKLLEDKGVEDTADILTICIAALMMTGDAISVSLVDRVGRRKLLLISFMGMAITTIGTTITMTVAEKNDEMDALNIFAIVLQFIFIMFYSAGVGTIPYFLSAELFNHSTRSVAVSLSASVEWLSNLLVAEAFKPLQNVLGSSILGIFIVLNLFFFFFVNMYLPESAKLTPKLLMKLFDYLD